MKHLLFLALTFFSLGLMGQSAEPAFNDYKSNFLKKWKNAAEYTIECAESMPEDKYDYKPTEEAMSFREQLLHMMRNMMWLSSDYLGGEKYDKALKDVQPSKAEMITMLKETFKMSTETVTNFPPEKLKEVVDFFAGPMEKQQIMMLMTDHMTHHRGQILVYMRLCGAKAPKYRGW